jgi:hypothetical protein
MPLFMTTLVQSTVPSSPMESFPFCHLQIENAQRSDKIELDGKQQIREGSNDITYKVQRVWHQKGFAKYVFSKSAPGFRKNFLVSGVACPGLRQPPG